MKSISLTFTGFVIKGVVDVKCWGASRNGGKSSLDMYKFNVSHLREIREGINDGGFGVEHINGAVCNIYKNYEGHLIYARTVIIGKVSDYILEREAQAIC